MGNDTAQPHDPQIAGALRFLAVAQSAPDAIISADGQGRIIFWNQAAQHIFGYAEHEILGKPITELMPPHLRDHHTAGMVRYQATGEKRAIGSIVELEGQRKTGEIFPIELSLSTWKTEDGQSFFNGIIRDISARKEAERLQREYAAALEERNQELYAYDRTIAHDLKAPLNVISTYASLIKQSHANALDHKTNQYLGRIEQSSFRMAEMIDQLLKLAALRDANTATMPTPIKPVVEKAVDRFHMQIETDKIMVEIQPDLPDAMGNAAWLEEVFANLVGNAIKYKGKDNTAAVIRVHGKIMKPLVRYEVIDNGLGIPPDVQNTLFEAFTRAHHEEASGFGLGLSIVSRIIHRLNGEVGVTSELGKGSTFWFTLPAVAD